MSKTFLRAANALVNFVVVLALVVVGVYAGYALWDNNRIYASAKDVQADMQKLKPSVEEIVEGESATFEDLLAVNSDVCGWITLDNTGVDFPILQGDSNLSYINTDVYGEFALAGSIFLDYRIDNTFSSPYNLLYGHHMEGGNMFGDLDLYEDESFFEENSTGTLLTPAKAYNLEIIACMLVSASDDYIFEPEQWQTDIDSLLTYVGENALCLREETLTEAIEGEDTQILAMSTCASDFTDARTIVLALMKPYANN